MRSEVRTMIDLYTREGMTPERIGRRLDRCGDLVRRALRKCGLAVNRSVGNQLRRSGRAWFTPSLREEVERFQRLGWPTSRMARRFGLPTKKLQQMIDPATDVSHSLYMRRRWNDPSIPSGARRLQRILTLARLRTIDGVSTRRAALSEGMEYGACQDYCRTPLYRAAVALIYGSKGSDRNAVATHYRAMFWDQGIPADWIAARFIDDTPEALEYVLKVVHGARGRKGE